MSKIKFSLNEMETLSKNEYVLKISEKSITYKDEFRALAISESLNGKVSSQIFKDAGFDLDIIGKKRSNSSLCRWKVAYKKHGAAGLKDTRKDSSGRPLERTLSKDEVIARKDAEIAYLRMELDIQKKLDMIERRALKKISKNIKS